MKKKNKNKNKYKLENKKDIGENELLQKSYEFIRANVSKEYESHALYMVPFGECLANVRSAY